ncbi:hypothetical protein DFS33DRAFT_1387015 [Desarmillaria ectypa]|nr:hypothetical protein DFS33DRAFT_1387015 [Desarmillaria ectypa]
MMVFHPLGILLDLTYAELFDRDSLVIYTFFTAKAAKTPLGIFRILSPRCRLRVSPLSWNYDQWEIYRHLYQDEQSEMWLGEWMEQRGNRDQLVVATKCSMSHKQHEISGTEQAIGANYGGNHTKPLRLSLKTATHRSHRYTLRSLVGLRENFEELMLALDTVFKSGKVRHLGIADAPAWVVAEANPPPSTLRSLPMSMVGHGLRWQGMLKTKEEAEE